MCFLTLWKRLKSKKGAKIASKTKSGPSGAKNRTGSSTGGKKLPTHRPNSKHCKDENKLDRKGFSNIINQPSERNSKFELKTNQELAAYSTDSLKLVPSNYQHIGSRDRQEDSFAFSDLNDRKVVEKKGVLAVIADGMGGLARGDRASQVAVRIFLREYNNKNDHNSIEHFMRRALTIANYAVFDLALDEKGQEVDLGTTLVAVLVEQGKMHWVSVGDSLVYLLRDGALRQLNKEHIYANQLADEVENGLISKKEAIEHPERSFLTSYLGTPELIEVDYSLEPLALKAGDVVLLCTDGLNNTLSAGEITAGLEHPDAGTAEELVKAAIAKGKPHQDNITVLVLSCQAVDSQ